MRRLGTDIRERKSVNIINTNKIGDNALTVVPNTELERIYRAGNVSPDVQNSFRTSLSKGVYSTEGMSIDQFIESNRKIKIEMKEYLDNYKVQRGLMEAVMYYLRHPDLAYVRFTDKVGGLFGKKLQLEAKRIANDPQAIRKLFEEMAFSIEQSRGKTLELEKHAVALYNISLTQRDSIENDITSLLQKISVNKDVTIKLETEYNKVKGDMNTLLTYMQEKLGMLIKGDKPVFELEGAVSILPETSVDQLIKEDNTEVKDTTSEGTEDTSLNDKRKIEAIKVYHSINNKLVKSENLLRDAQNEKLVLHQNYERAKENLTLYERVLLNQVNEARNYFALLFAIYDAEVKYTLPSARLIAHLASLQEVAIELAQQIYDSRNIFNNLLDSVTQGALEIQEGIIMLAITPSWDSARIDQSEERTIELTRRTREFTIEMDKRLTEIETVYREPNQIRTNERPGLDNGVDNEYLHKLLEK